MVISYRLHGLVSAAAYGVPAMGVAYDPKVSAFCNEIGYPHCYPATVHSELTTTDISRLWQERHEVELAVAESRTKMLSRLAKAEEEFHALW